MIKKKTFAVSNDGIPSAMDPKSLQCRVTLLDGEEIVQDFNVSAPGALSRSSIRGLLRAQVGPLFPYMVL